MSYKSLANVPWTLIYSFIEHTVSIQNGNSFLGTHKALSVKNKSINTNKAEYHRNDIEN